MNNKPITPAWHGIIDYGFAAIQLAAPSLLGLNRQTIRTYQVLGGGFMVVNAITDTPAAVKPIISLKTHQKVDAAFLVGVSLLSFTRFIRRDRQSLGFHLGFLGTAITNYVLTDYEAGT